MAAIKNTTPTKALLLALATLVICGAFSSLQQAVLRQRVYPLTAALDAKKPINMGFSWLSGDAAYQQNLAVMAMIVVAADMPIGERMQTLSQARSLQEQALAASPADPYGWLRLSYLRRVTQGNKHGAFDALKMSVAAAPYEPRIMHDRAVAWTDLGDVQSADDAALKDRMWQLAKQAEKARY